MPIEPNLRRQSYDQWNPNLPYKNWWVIGMPNCPGQHLHEKVGHSFTSKSTNLNQKLAKQKHVKTAIELQKSLACYFSLFLVLIHGMLIVHLTFTLLAWIFICSHSFPCVFSTSNSFKQGERLYVLPCVAICIRSLSRRKVAM